ncbi:MAG TPA: type II toxin-antitoxin system RelE/ParE family toxin [Candidatus Limnocylindria bacterium]|nr:type II toxin-antitoxin system RelE/ParE family toxin [Candidatus Limnocylindria bacterium]
MRIFKNAWFSRFARRENIKDAVLVDAVARAERGVIDADLGGGVIKQRIARPGQGKSGGYRSFILFRKGTQAFFVYGFAKSDRENIEYDELEKFKFLAKAWFSLSDKQIEAMTRDKALTEVKHEEK